MVVRAELRVRCWRAVLATARALQVRPHAAPPGAAAASHPPASAVAAAPAVAAGRKVMWEPTPAAVEQTAMRRFQQSVGVDGGYEELWRWSVEHSDEFWSELMGFVGVEYSGSLSPVKEGSAMPDVTYFPGVQLNFAENMLRHGAPGAALANAEALVSVSESRDDKRWTFAELADDASRVRAALEKLGVTSSDACGAYLSNIGETIVAMLGRTATGATWTSCSPDLGRRRADRFGQVSPKVLFTCDAFMSAGKRRRSSTRSEESSRRRRASSASSSSG